MSTYRSSDTMNGPTIRRMRGKVLDVHAEHWWYRCSGGDCVQAFWAGNCVNVVDTKLGPASPIQRWPAELWEELLDAIRDGGPVAVGPSDRIDSPYASPAVEVVNDMVWLNGDPRHHENLTFTLAEWNEFVVGVLAKRYELDRLRSFAGAAVRGSGKVVELSGPVSVLAGDAGEVDSHLPVGRVDQVVAGAAQESRPGAVPAAADPDSPAGRTDDGVLPSLGVETGQPGPSDEVPNQEDPSAIRWSEDIHGWCRLDDRGGIRRLT